MVPLADFLTEPEGVIFVHDASLQKQFPQPWLLRTPEMNDMGELVIEEMSTVSLKQKK
jgi:hypothetical protein